MWRRVELGTGRDGGVAPDSLAGLPDETVRLWRGLAHAVALAVGFWAGLICLLTW